MKKTLALTLLPLLASANVSMGPGPNTYQVDQWGSDIAPTKEEMHPSGSGKGCRLIWEDSANPKAPSFMYKPQY